MVLNPALYAVLQKHFGQVKISNEDIERVEERIPGKDAIVLQRGEHYNVNCPICHDRKYRLSISYQWLVKPPMTNKRITHLVHCYNENCEELRTPEFYDQFLEDLELAEMGLLEVALPEKKVSARTQSPIRLPRGFRLLSELPAHHRAIEFVKTKYQIPYDYLSDGYSVGFTDQPDELYWAAPERIIFPIYNGGRLIAWQGRTIQDVEPRWYLPPGFIKCVYNGDRVQPFDTPIIAEGIPSAIACGPNGVCIFGKSIPTLLVHEFAEKWSSVIIATDPETFVEDPREKIRRTNVGRTFASEMADALGRHIRDVRMIQWPTEILELAKRKVNGDKVVHVPDPADLGLPYMKRLIEEVA
jgi:hypothetical protein